MQVRCYNCHKQFSLSMDTILAALDQVSIENLKHYNTPCPYCRRINRVSAQELHRAAPDWKQPVNPDESDAGQ